MSDPYNAAELAQNKENLKLLDRDEKKEHEELRKLLIKLTPFQIRFVEQYIRTASAGLAAKYAGSTSGNLESIGYKLLQNPNIQQAIAIAMKKRIEAVGLDTIEVIQKLREVYDSAMKVGKFTDANKACELLLKEIERSSKPSQSNTLAPTKAGLAYIDPRLPQSEEDETQQELNRVISLVRKKPIISEIPKEAS